MSQFKEELHPRVKGEFVDKPGSEQSSSIAGAVAKSAEGTVHRAAADKAPAAPGSQKAELKQGSKPTPSTVEISDDEKRNEAKIKNILGIKDMQELADLVGVPHGAKIDVYDVMTNKVRVDVNHPMLHALRTFQLHGDGTRSVHNDSFSTKVKMNGEKTTGKGIGSAVFSHQVEALVEHGYSEIRTLAAGDYEKARGKAPTNGYYTWPRLGYDAPFDKRALTLKQEAEVNSFAPHAEMLSDLMQTQTGRDWWRLNGQGDEMTFDLTDPPPSKSLQILRAYMEQRSKIKSGSDDNKGVTNARNEEDMAPADTEQIDLTDDEDMALDSVWDNANFDQPQDGTLPGSDDESYFGSPDQPLPDWRTAPGADQNTDEEGDDEPSDLDAAGVNSMLGFDPARPNAPVRNVFEEAKHPRVKGKFTWTAIPHDMFPERIRHEAQREHGRYAIRGIGPDKKGIPQWELGYVNHVNSSVGSMHRDKTHTYKTKSTDLEELKQIAEAHDPIAEKANADWMEAQSKTKSEAENKEKEIRERKQKLEDAKRSIVIDKNVTSKELALLQKIADEAMNDTGDITGDVQADLVIETKSRAALFGSLLSKGLVEREDNIVELDSFRNVPGAKRKHNQIMIRLSKAGAEVHKDHFGDEPTTNEEFDELEDSVSVGKRLAGNEFQESEHPRVKGKWIDKGGATEQHHTDHLIGEIAAEGKPKRLSAVDKVKKYGEKALQTKVGRFVKQAEHKLFYFAHKTRDIAVDAAQRRGFDKEKTDKLARTLAIADFAGGYVSGGAAALTLSPAAGKLAMYLPSVSALYLVYSTARSPVSTWMAAKSIMSKRKSDEPVTNAVQNDFAEGLADLMDEYEDTDWVQTVVLMAVSNGSPDPIADAQAVLNEYPENPDEDEDGDDENDFDLPIGMDGGPTANEFEESKHPRVKGRWADVGHVHSMSKEEFAKKTPEGFEYKPNEGENIARYTPSKKVMLTDAFFDHSHEDRKQILAHEIAHGVVDSVTKDPQQFWPMVDSGLLGHYDDAKNRFIGSTSGQRNADEVLADAVADVHLGGERESRLKTKHPGVHKLASSIHAGETITPEHIKQALSNNEFKEELHPRVKGRWVNKTGADSASGIAHQIKGEVMADKNKPHAYAAPWHLTLDEFKKRETKKEIAKRQKVLDFDTEDTKQQLDKAMRGEMPTFADDHYGQDPVDFYRDKLNALHDPKYTEHESSSNIRFINRLKSGEAHHFEYDLEEKHAKSVKQAVEQGKEVRPEVLETYRHTSWMPETTKQQIDKERQIRDSIKHADQDIANCVQKGLPEKAKQKMDAVRPTLDFLHAQALEIGERKSKEVDALLAAMHKAAEDGMTAIDKCQAVRQKYDMSTTGDEVEKLPVGTPGRSEYMEQWNEFKRLSQSQEMFGDQWKTESRMAKKYVWDTIAKHGTPKTKVVLEGSVVDNAKEACDFLSSVMEASAHGDLMRVKSAPIPAKSSLGPDRAFYRQSEGSIYVNSNESTSVVVHEIAHHVECAGTLGPVSKGFMINQTEGSKTQHLGSHFENYEVFRDDKMATQYSGKWYGLDSTEVISVGAEHLFEDPTEFARKAPEHFKYTIGVLRGDIKMGG